MLQPDRLRQRPPFSRRQRVTEAVARTIGRNDAQSGQPKRCQNLLGKTTAAVQDYDTRGSLSAFLQKMYPAPTKNDVAAASGCVIPDLSHCRQTEGDVVSSHTVGYRTYFGSANDGWAATRYLSVCDWHSKRGA